jgi:hypothetical protein
MQHSLFFRDIQVVDHIFTSMHVPNRTEILNDNILLLHIVCDRNVCFQVKYMMHIVSTLGKRSYFLTIKMKYT